MKLWIFGDSLSLPYHIDSKGWSEIVADHLGYDHCNFSQPAADNFFIYSSYLHALPNISKEDVIVIGWSHPSRKSFVLDRNNPEHVKTLENSLLYKTDIEFIRSKNPLNDTLSKWQILSPAPKNKPFYDTWYKDYYSSVEQRSNLFAYYSSVRATCPGFYVPFFFSLESIQGLAIDQHAGTMLEFLFANQCYISQEDAHLNQIGHQLWADNIIAKLQR